MSYLITQTFILLLVAGLLGLILGWYLTRISAAGARAALQARLRNLENDVRELRQERDRAVNARDTCETERRVLSDDLNDLRARQGDGAGDAALQAELDRCRAALAEAAQADNSDYAALQADLAECRTALEALTDIRRDPPATRHNRHRPAWHADRSDRRIAPGAQSRRNPWR